MRPAAEKQSRRPLALLAPVVLALHLWLANEHWPARLGEGAASRTPQRIEVAFVRELLPAQPPPPPAAPPPPPRQRRINATPPAPAASAPPMVLAETAPPEPTALPALPELAAAPPVPVATAASASAGAAFDWPPSTRLSYTLVGEYQGPVEGQAQVEWLREGTRYQVHMTVSVGPPFAPLFSRRVTSEGEITPQGLKPSRYDEETRVLLDTRRLTIWLGDEQVRLPNGQELPRPEGVQDSASQFVQMTWLFTTQPERLQAGRSLEIPLALPRRVEPWIYDVVGTEDVATPVGLVSAVHVKPRREIGRGNELTPELWVAPSLQYLPVRMLIRRDANTWMDLTVQRLPQQAAPGR